MQRLCATRYSQARSAHRARVDAQRVVGAQEHVLQHVLGVGARAAEHLARVGEQPLAVAVVDDAEGLVVAGAEERHELVVASAAAAAGPVTESRPRPAGCESAEASTTFLLRPL